MAAIEGFHHLSLSVRDLERSIDWYSRVLGLEVETQFETEDFSRARLKSPDDAVTLTLTRHNEQDPEAFNERRTGMDHFAFRVADDVGALKRLFERLGVEHSEIQQSGGGKPMIVLRDPDNIQLEVVGSESSGDGGG